MTRQLTRLADFTYRRRGTVVLAWIGAMIVLIGLGSALKGEYEADYNTPGSESKAASDLTEREFGGYSGQEVYVVWKDPNGADSPAAKKRVNAFLAEAEDVNHIDPATKTRVSDDGTIATTTLPMTVPGWEMTKEDGEQLVDAAERNSGDGLADQARRGPDLPRPGRGQPRGVRLPRGGDRPPDRLRLIGRRRPAAGDRPGRPRDHLRRPDPAAGQRRQRPRLDDRGLRADRDRGRDRLLAAGPDPVQGRSARRQGPPRRGGRGDHHRRAERDHRRLHGRDRRPRAVPDRAHLHVRGGALGLAGGARRDARLDHPAAGPPLLPRPEGRPAAGPAPRPCPEDGRHRGVARLALEPRRPAPSVDGGDRGDGPAAGAGGAGARDAARVPRCRQRPAGHDDPPGLRPDLRRVRARHQRPAGDRGRTPLPERKGRHQRPGRRAARRRGSRLRHRSPLQPGGRRGVDHRGPDDLPSGRGDPRPGQAPARDRPARSPRRHRDHRPGRRRDRGARGPERLHGRPHAAVHRRRGRALVPVAPDRLPRAADLAQGGGDEPALGQRRLRRDDPGREGRRGRRADRDRPRGPDRALHAGDDVRDPVRALDGLRGLPGLADPRGVPEGRRQHQRRWPRAWRKRPA